MFRLRATGLILLISACAAAASPPSQDSSTHKDSIAGKRDSLVKKITPTPSSPPPSYHWPIDTTETVCREPLETAAECWRNSSRWATQEIGFPGARSRTLSLSSLEPAAINPFYQLALSETPYGLGGHLPFERVGESVGEQSITEVWTPVLPVDTPVTSLHWMRGALQLNQFTMNLRRMVGNRAYLGLQIHSDRAATQFYEYPFNVHQPYLAGWGVPALKRDSASLVIEDTSHNVQAIQMRPRLGFWIDSQTVVETFADWIENKSSLANPTNPAPNDLTQLLYPASFSALTLGAVAARSTTDYRLRFVLTRSDWDRELYPRGDSAAKFSETSSGNLNRLMLEGSPLRIPGALQIGMNLETGRMEKGWSNREEAWIKSHPSFFGKGGPLSLDLIANAGRRERPDGIQEAFGGGSGDVNLSLPYQFKATGGAEWKREGAGDDTLFRWQPALGLYPNPDLKPRTDLRLMGGGSWEIERVGFGAAWEHHRFGENWLPRVLPEMDFCLYADTSRYPLEHQPLCVDAVHVPDSLALGLVNYREETRDLLHLSLLVHLGNWRLSLLNTYLIGNAVRDDRLRFTELNRQLPEQVHKGQLLWRRKVLEGKLGLQTQWDWEWISARYVFASDLNGYSRSLKLDEYLALDFTARMEIKTFLLYFRAMNLNHDRYATEPGVHPPGVNFRFGVDWRLWN